MMGVDYSNGWCHGHCLGIRNCLCHRDRHDWRVSIWANLASLLIDPVSEIRLPWFESSVLVQMFSEIRLAAEAPSAATRA